MNPMLTILLLAGAPVAVAAQTVFCPTVLPKETVTISAPAGWRGYSSSIVRLTGFGMMAGPPESMTYLVPADSRKEKGGSTTTWRFEGGGEKWLYCTYDGSAAIQISRRLEDRTTSCRATAVTERPGMLQAVSLDCR